MDFVRNPQETISGCQGTTCGTSYVPAGYIWCITKLTASVLNASSSRRGAKAQNIYQGTGKCKFRRWEQNEVALSFVPTNYSTTTKDKT